VVLTGVELDAWQPIMLPRRLDDPEREPDDDPHEELAAFAQRVKEAMKRWGEVVKVLRIVGVSVN
jgi:hypothetical protein